MIPCLSTTGHDPSGNCPNSGSEYAWRVNESAIRWFLPKDNLSLRNIIADRTYSENSLAIIEPQPTKCQIGKLIADCQPAK